MMFLKLFAVSYTLQVAYIPNQALLVNDSIYRGATNEMYTNLGISIVVADRIEIGGYAITEAKPMHLLSFIPTQGTYEAHISANFGPVTVGFSHQCSHSIVNKQSSGAVTQNYRTLQSGRNEVFVRIEGVSRLEK